MAAMNMLLLPACTTCMGAGNAGAAGINTAIFVLVGATLFALGIVAWCGWRIFSREGSAS